MLKNRIKSLASDTITYGFFQTLSRFFTYLLVPLYSHYLIPSENGVLAYMFGLISLAQFIYAFGMEAAFFRFFKKNDEEYNKKVFTVAFLTIGLLSLTSTFFLILFSNNLANIIIGSDVKNSVFLFQTACLIPFFDNLVVIPYGKLRMLRQIKRFTVTRCALVLITVFFIAYFIIFTNLGVAGVFLGQVITAILGVIIFLPEILKMMDFNFERKLFFEMLKFGIPTLPSSLSAIALQVGDRPIMKLFIDSSEIGIYQINAKLAVPMLMFCSVFDYAWKPFYLTHYDENDAKQLFSRVLTYYMLASSLLFLLISLFVDYIVRIPLWNGKFFINPDYWSGIGVVSFIVLGYLINGVTTNFAAVFHIEKKTKFLPLAVVTSATVSILLNFTLIPIIGSIGAAISLVFGYLTGAILMKFLQKKVNYKINYEWKRIFLIVFIAAFIFFCNKLIPATVSLEIAFFIKIGLIFLFLILLKVLGFFTVSELSHIKKVFKR